MYIYCIILLSRLRHASDLKSENQSCEEAGRGCRAAGVEEGKKRHESNSGGEDLGWHAY